MKRIYIVRHAEVDTTTRHYSLSAQGWNNSITFGNYLNNQKDFSIPEKFYSSDRARSIETARIILMVLNKDQAELKINNLFGEFNPPAKELEKIEKTEEYIKLKSEGKRSSLYFDWTGKKEAVQDYLKVINTILLTSDSVLIVSHANILNFILFNLFPDDVRIQNNTETPNLSLTIIEKQDDIYSLVKISSLDWKNKVIS